jgi:APA family basic amino acid/polyamine antiporter
VGHPWTTGIVLLGSLAFLAAAIAGDRRNSLIGLALVIVSYPAFRLSRPAGVPLPSADPYLSE